MGISGLLPLLKSIHKHIEVKKFAGETLAVDGYGWLHRGAVACAIELAEGKPTRKYVDFAMHRVRMLKHHGVTPYVVFDGDFLPSKASTEESRAKRREESRKAGLALLKAGKGSQAHLELQKAIDVSPEMARNLIEELKKADIPYVVAPYEADAQLVYLERHGFVTGIISEDSDLLVFGAKRLLTKMDQYGQCVEINRKDFCAVREVSLTGWTDKEFRHMAILSGCDYLKGLENMGLKTAYRAIRKHKTPERVIRMLQFDGKHRIPPNYWEDFQQADLTFLYQRVFDPEKQDMAFLNEPDVTVDIDSMPFIGAAVETEMARAIACGDINPITKQVIEVQALPGRRGTRQAARSVPSAPIAPSPRQPVGKPIDSYFQGHRRIPLGEMDPNCFMVKQRQAGDARPVDIPRVFPLPRPYIEDSPIPRPYRTNEAPRLLRRRTEPISNLIGMGNNTDSDANRRRTVGPDRASSVARRDSLGSSMRPPKKPRLCEDLPLGDGGGEASEKSKFFSPAGNRESNKKKSEAYLMSDDSVEEALLSLPDIDGWASVKPRRLNLKVDVFQEGSNKEGNETTAAEEVVVDTTHQPEAIIPNSDIEVPASSPPAPSGVENTPVDPFPEEGVRFSLRQFTCPTTAMPNQTSRNRTVFAHGLPTPSSSIQKPGYAVQPTRAHTPLLTPLQRMGHQALQRANTPSSTNPADSQRSGSKRKKRASWVDLPVNPSFVPLPRVDVAEVEALSKPCGSEDQIIPDSDGENDPDCAGFDDDGSQSPPGVISRQGSGLSLSRFMYR